MATSEKVSVPVGEKLSGLIWRVYRVAVAFEALGGGTDKPKSVLAGFAFAMALVEKELAELKSQMSSEIYRTIAKAGHDVGAVANIYTDIQDGRPWLAVTFADLIDHAETGDH